MELNKIYNEEEAMEFDEFVETYLSAEVVS